MWILPFKIIALVNHLVAVSQAARLIRQQQPKLPHHYKDVCGKPGVFSKLRPTLKIINGTCDPYGAHPWVVQIQVRNTLFTQTYYHHCGGAILTEDYILTAAHCFTQFSSSNNDDATSVRRLAKRMRVVAGQQFLDKMDEEEIIFDVDNVVIHPDWSYSSDDHANDLALIRLRRKGDGSGLKFNDFVTPVCVPTYEIPDKEGTTCTVAGWGSTATNDELQPGKTVQNQCLLSASLPLLSNDKCQGLFPGRIKEGMMCAGVLTGGADTCQGDSGGPLTCKHKGRFYVHGVVSWGYGCGLPNKPGIYSKVKTYVDWIEQTILTH